MPSRRPSSLGSRSAAIGLSHDDITGLVENGDNRLVLFQRFGATRGSKNSGVNVPPRFLWCLISFFFSTAKISQRLT